VTDAEIEKKVIDIVAQHTDAEPESITRETSFTNDLNADSLDIVELLMEFEAQFGTNPRRAGGEDPHRRTSDRLHQGEPPAGLKGAPPGGGRSAMRPKRLAARAL